MSTSEPASGGVTTAHVLTHNEELRRAAPRGYIRVRTSDDKPGDSAADDLDEIAGHYAFLSGVLLDDPVSLARLDRLAHAALDPLNPFVEFLPDCPEPAT